MKSQLEELIEKWESEIGSYIPNTAIYEAFINEAKQALEKEKLSGSELLIPLVRKDTDVLLSGGFKGRLIGFRPESFLVEYNHNGHSEWIESKDINLSIQ